MSLSEENLKEIQDELKWVRIREEQSFTDKLLSKGVVGLLVPVGCFVTTGILFNGVYNMIKKNSKKQQRLMRYRVLAQGVTVLFTAIGMWHIKFSS